MFYQYFADYLKTTSKDRFSIFHWTSFKIPRHLYAQRAAHTRANFQTTYALFALHAHGTREGMCSRFLCSSTAQKTIPTLRKENKTAMRISSYKANNTFKQAILKLR